MLTETNINYSRTINYGALGTNGYSKAKGMYLHSTGSNLQISPINSKGDVTRCHIEVPREDVPELIKQLQAMI